jgi:Leucine-rich repeat (LRR) protein
MKLLTSTAVSLLLIGLTMSGTAYSQVPQIERDALIALYNSTGGANWTTNTGWLGDVGTECDWYGVTCGGSGIDNLNLSRNNLVGTIPAELGSLSNLTTLNLWDNQLSGSIPSELGNLTNLTQLVLGSNSLSGSIPAELGNLTNLTELYLYTNSLSGSIPAELGNLTNLTVFWLFKNSLSGSIPAELGNLTNLTMLPLYKNSLSGSIPAELGNLTNLIALTLHKNSLSGSIPAELGNLTNLTSLHLYTNQLSGSIPAELGNLSNLTTLNLYDNQLSGSIPSELGNLSSLNYFRLYTNALTGSIPTELGGLTNLIELSLGHNQLSGSIPSELGSLSNLTTLNLYDNQLSGSIPSELGSLSNLTILNLSTNSLTGPLPQWLSDMAISTLNVTDAFTSAPVVAISGGNRTIEDSDGIAGESVSFTGTATDSDGTIATTQWLVDGSEVATGLSATIALSDGATVVTLKATDNDGAATSATATITVEVPNVPPSVAISGGNRTIADTDSAAGESVSFTGTATDSDGTVATTQWLVGGSVVATGLTPNITLPNGSTVVTFKATDNVGLSTTTTTTITITAPAYTATDEWPSPYNGVTPDSSLGLAFNNIGIYDAAGSTIYTCLRVFTDGLPGSVGGIGEFDIGFTVVSIDEGTVQITKFREFNVIGALNENVELPDCSGKFETTTAVFTDTIETKLYTNLLGNLLPVVKTYNMTFDLIDGDNLILKLSSYQELTAD